MISKNISITTKLSNPKKANTNGNVVFTGHRYEQSENKDFYKLFHCYDEFKSAGAFVKQRVNIPEGLTEGLVAKDIPGVYRKIRVVSNNNGKSKFDCYDDINKKIIEVKACSIPNDLTSWSPDPYFDVLYFVDFSDLNGVYRIYKIETTSDELKNEKVSSSETFQDQVNDSRRPRFSVFEKYITPRYKCSGKPVFEDDLRKYSI